MPSIASGSISIFKMASTPPGWTQITTYNDYALRITNSTVGTVSAQSFTTCFTNRTVSGTATYTATVGGTTLSTAQIASHSHTVGGVGSTAGSSYSNGGFTGNSLAAGISSSPASMGSAGGGSGHTHTATGPSPVPFSGSTFNMAIKYVDVIIAQRN